MNLKLTAGTQVVPTKNRFQQKKNHFKIRKINIKKKCLKYLRLKFEGIFTPETELITGGWLTGGGGRGQNNMFTSIFLNFIRKGGGEEGV